jgi:hypothetical protein
VADLTDKEVGELWREWSVVENDDAWPEAKPICDLIRKLVKERAKHRGGVTKALSYQLALSDFAGTGRIR